MKTSLKKKLSSFEKLTNRWNLLILIILLVALILRIYRIGEILDFHYDQGRDAMVIWNLWHQGKLFLIGPVTGLPGIFLGPFYYYLIAPFYLISGGNPAIPSIFLSVLVVTSLYILYLTGKEIGGKKLGLIALLIGVFSYYLIMSSRWLSNPTPIYLTSILIFYFFVKIIRSKTPNPICWYLAYLLVGVSLHFESASAAFYIPALLAFTVWNRKKMTFKSHIISSLLLFFTFIPQLIFNFRHDNILLNNLITEFSGRQNFPSDFTIQIISRFKTFWDVFSNKIFYSNRLIAGIFSIISATGLYLYSKDEENKKLLKIFFLFLGISAICYLIYQGNYGNLYDYYFTCYYLILILLFSVGLWRIAQLRRFGNIILISFFILFSFFNLPPTINKLTDGVYEGNNIYLTTQLSAISWIYEDTKEIPFNVDIYVPPVIPYSYDYLFIYVGDKRSQNLTKRLYTLYEIDPPHPERLEAWLKRQEGIGTVQSEMKFGGIVVQKRERK